MRLLFLNSAKDWGGNEKWTYLAARSLSEDHDVYLAYRMDFLGNRFDFELEKFKLPFFFEFDLLTIFKIISIIKNKKIDILIPTKRKDYVLAGLTAKICRKKNILRLGIVRDLKNSWYNNLVYNKLADGVIVNAKYIKEVLIKSKFMKAEKIRVIYNGLDLDKLKEAVSKDNSQEKGSFIISSMGRITKVKGFEYLIRGFKHFLSVTNAQNAELLIIGEGDYLHSLKDLVRSLNISNKVNFSGFLKDPYPFLTLSKVFIMISKNEGISNALLEGMYLKNAVISTPVGGTREVINDGRNGVLLNTINVKKLGELILEFYQNPTKRKKFADEAHKTVSKKFSLARMKGEIENYFKEFL